jgi:hypothetical protein
MTTQSKFPKTLSTKLGPSILQFNFNQQFVCKKNSRNQSNICQQGMCYHKTHSVFSFFFHQGEKVCQFEHALNKRRQ